MSWVLFGATLLLMGQSAAFDPKPLVEDLHVVRTAFAEKYANLEWAGLEREAALECRFADAEVALLAASSDAEARAIFDRFARRLGDAHVVFRWPSPKPSTGRVDKDLCARLDMGTQPQVPSVGTFAQGYSPLKPAGPDEFVSGVFQADGEKVGVLRIRSFDFEQAPGLCREALAALKIPANAACDDACEERVDAWAYERMTHHLPGFVTSMTQLLGLKTLEPIHVDYLARSLVNVAAGRLGVGEILDGETLWFVRSRGPTGLTYGAESTTPFAYFAN